MKSRIVFRLLLLSLLTFAFALPLAAQEETYFPTTGWRTSAPEEQGIDSAKLGEVLGQLRLGTESVHSLLVIRNGFVVLDASSYPFRPDQPHWLYSAVKSITSTLVGVAIDRGYIESVDQSIWDFFSQADTANMDERKAAITLRHLLTHTSGLMMWSREDYAMYDLTADDQSWVQYVLDMPMTAAPGMQFNYLDANTQLLSAIIGQVTGMSAADFAQEVLFAPLDMTPSAWRADPQGVSWGGDGLALSPYDMAKLGYLYLHHGEWDGQQIVSPEWVAAATAVQTGTSISEAYGYLWWVGDFGVYPNFLARGHGGQEIWVVPDQDLIVVLTGDNAIAGPTWIDAFIMPAIVSDEALPANPQAYAELTAKVAAMAEPVAAEVPALSAAVADVAGRRIALAENPLRWESLSLSFADDEAVLSVNVAGIPLELPFGLDGVYRMSSDGVLAETAGLPTGPFWQPLPDAAVAGRLTQMRDNGLTLRFWDLSGGQAWDIRMRIDETIGIQVMPSLIDGSVQLEGTVE
jgi:CubicO group peptidase (beta-lactamase class C family)